MKANEFKIKVTDKNGVSAIITLDNIYGYEGEECGVFIDDERSDEEVPRELKGKAINYNSGYGYHGVNEDLDFEYVIPE